MKKVLIALAILGMAFSGAEAQTKKDPKKDKTCVTPAKKLTHKKVAKATPAVRKDKLVTKQYQVCREEGGYYSCCLYTKTSPERLW